MGRICSKTYKANFKDDFEIAGDITKIDENDIPQFDICLAGFPCQAFSLAGKGKDLKITIKECAVALYFWTLQESVNSISRK